MSIANSSGGSDDLIHQGIQNGRLLIRLIDIYLKFVDAEEIKNERKPALHIKSLTNSLPSLALYTIAFNFILSKVLFLRDQIS